MANGLRLYQRGCVGGGSLYNIGCPNKALCKRWRSLIAICLNVCYTIFQRLTLCNPSSCPTLSSSLCDPFTPCCCLLLLRCAFYFRCSMIFNLSESTLPSTVPGVIERQHHHPPPMPHSSRLSYLTKMHCSHAHSSLH